MRRNHLTLDYDILKAFGGEIKVNTKEGEFAEFKFNYPIDKNDNPIHPIKIINYGSDNY